MGESILSDVRCSFRLARRYSHYSHRMSKGLYIWMETRGSSNEKSIERELSILFISFNDSQTFIQYNDIWCNWSRIQ